MLLRIGMVHVLSGRRFVFYVCIALLLILFTYCTVWYYLLNAVFRWWTARVTYFLRRCWVFVFLCWVLHKSWVFWLTLCISTWIYLLKRTQIVSLVFVSLFLQLSYLSLPFLSTQFRSFSSINPSIKNLLGSFKSLISRLGGNIHEHKSISDQIALYKMIKRSLSSKTGSIIDFQKVQLIPIVNHEVKPKNLKTHIISQIVLLSNPILMLKMRLTRNQSLDNSFLDIAPILVSRKTNSLQSLKKLSQRFLVAQT